MSVLCPTAAETHANKLIAEKGLTRALAIADEKIMDAPFLVNGDVEFWRQVRAAVSARFVYGTADLKFTHHLARCRSCGELFRVSQESIDDMRKSGGYRGSAADIANCVDFCLECAVDELHVDEKDGLVQARDVSTEVVPHSGAIVCATVVDGQRKHTVYYGMDREEAIGRFLATLNGLPSHALVESRS